MASRAWLLQLLLVSLALAWCVSGDSVTDEIRDEIDDASFDLASPHHSSFVRRRLWEEKHGFHGKPEHEHEHEHKPEHHGPGIKGHDQEGMNWSAWGGSWRGPAGTYAFGRGVSCKGNPLVCTTDKSAVGKDCCGAFCTDKTKDVANCGYCGKKCNSPKSACCYGNCVNLLTDNYNCGRCGKRCGKNTCQYGICAYNGKY